MALLAVSDIAHVHFYAVGFFEALRMECGDQIDVTICCPPSVKTGMRDEKVGRLEEATVAQLASAAGAFRHTRPKQG